MKFYLFSGGLLEEFDIEEFEKPPGCKVYLFRCDGFNICKVALMPGNFETQDRRDAVRSAVTKHYKIPFTYLRMHWTDAPAKFRYTDMKTGEGKSIPVKSGKCLPL